MQWSDIPFHPQRRTLRQFAACWLVVFTLLGLVQYQLHHRHPLGLLLIGGAVLLGIPGLFRPQWLRPVFAGWMVLAFPIGWGVSLLVLLLLYFVIFTPIAWGMRLARRDALGRKPAPGRETFWTPKSNPVDAGQYFRQY